MSNKICVIGAGFSGATVARELARAGYEVDVWDSRPHIAGNCHTEIDPATGILIHVYGPHIFHTKDSEVWEYVNQFADFSPFFNRVKAHRYGTVYSLPVNLHTINQLFSTTLGPAEARAYLRQRAVSYDHEPRSFEEQALSMLGPELYEAFFKYYTEKQWGVSPTELPASILKRLPVRFDYDDRYYSDPHQGIPRQGYTALMQRMLAEPGVAVSLGRKFAAGRDDMAPYAHVFYTGPLDEYFDYRWGRLEYRSLSFEKETVDGDYQGNPVINYCGPEVPWTRITEHKYFMDSEVRPAEKSVIFREFSYATGKNDVPFYPLRLVDDKKLLGQYQAAAYAETGVTFLGRLATYRYIDMDLAVREALDVSRAYITAIRDGRPAPKSRIE